MRAGGGPCTGAGRQGRAATVWLGQGSWVLAVPRRTPRSQVEGRHLVVQGCDGFHSSWHCRQQHQQACGFRPATWPAPHQRNNPSRGCTTLPRAQGLLTSRPLPQRQPGAEQTLPKKPSWCLQQEGHGAVCGRGKVRAGPTDCRQLPGVGQLPAGSVRRAARQPGSLARDKHT